MKKIITLFSIALAFSSCKNQIGGSKINCEIAGVADGKAILMDVSPQKMIAVDTVEIKGGKATFKNEFSQERIAALKFADGKQFLFIAEPKKTISIKGDMNVPNSLVYTGSVASQGYVTLLKNSNSGQNQDIIKGAIDTINDPLLGLLSVSMLNPDGNASSYKKVAELINAKLPGSDYATHINGQVSQISAQSAVASGTTAPDLEVPNREGKLQKLSSLRGKVVLIDFWASWCRPCRMENPNVVKAYDQYKDKGFTIYSVSLDNSKDKWLEAIKADNLKWDNHVSELKGWQSEAAKAYGVNSIPRTFLLDKDGKIVASNLRGPALEEKLAELLK